MRIGFIGLGSMGGQQADLIAEAGFDLLVYDAFADTLQKFRDKARLAASPAEVGQGADMVGICVRDDQQVREVLLGQHGLLAALPAGALVLIHSTVAPQTIKELAAAAAARGVALMDAAVTRSQHGQPGAFVVTMTGGDPSLTERARPILECFSTAIVHCGELGAGMGLKITNNFVTWSHVLIIRQALNLASASGVDIDKLAGIMEQNGNLTKATAAVLSGVVERNGRPFNDAERSFFDSQGRIGEKDLDLAIDFARLAGVQLPTAVHVRERVHSSMITA